MCKEQVKLIFIALLAILNLNLVGCNSVYDRPTSSTGEERLTTEQMWEDMRK